MEPLKVYIRDSCYVGSLPKFYDSKDFRELDILIENWEIIRDELFEYEKKIGTIGNDTYMPPELGKVNKWKNIYIDNFLWRSHKNCKYFPKTINIIKQIGVYTYCAFSILDPQGEIKEHYGDTNAIIRCHLGLSVPSSLPECGIKVGDCLSDWEDGKLTMFTEAHLHKTWNHTEQSRYLFVIDIINPKFTINRMYLCASVLGAQTYNFIESRYPILKKLPTLSLKPIHYFFTVLWLIYLPLQRRCRDCC